ncbi:hypothetical protein CHS0354_016065 [Potamilus streckersoni]|uniref:Uncharacterized protein n=1 Tax=Potamilus streckersoni TaxID=2493646 RepID=A0AAE0T164_9BIVA|nr:hypothetical protein CHS0354_016065 [Potamilus streckersoni]
MEAGARGITGFQMEHVASHVVDVKRLKPGTGPAPIPFPRMVEDSAMELQWNLEPLNAAHQRVLLITK